MRALIAGVLISCSTFSCKNEKVSIKELRSGSRRREVSGIRALIAIGLVKNHGVALAEVARRVGVSAAAASKIIKRASQ